MIIDPHLPKLFFKLPTVTQEARLLFSFCHPRPTGWDWSERVYKNHPLLQDALVGIKNNDAAYHRCLTYARKYIKDNKKELTRAIKSYQKEWNKFGPNYLKLLSSHLETDYPKTLRLIKVFVSINPICPRYLNTWSFTVRYNRPQYLRKTACHEILHFLYFKKWLEVFPSAKRCEFDSPYLTWKLSEIIAPTVLNHHPKISKIVKLYSPGYREFQNVKIGKTKLIPHFEKLYLKHLHSSETFADFLRLIWNETLRYRKAIERI